MALTFWSDKKITLTVSGKASNNTGISDIIITGSNGLLCSDTIVSNDVSTVGSGKTNYETGNTDASKVTFYASVADPTKSSATGNISILIKWQGLDHTANTADDRFSDAHVISNITIKNAVGNVKFSASNDIWINGATISENTINLNVSLVTNNNFAASNANNYIYYTSSEGDNYEVYQAPVPSKMSVQSNTDGIIVAKKTADNTSITLLFAKNEGVNIDGSIDYSVRGSYESGTVSENSKTNIGLFTGKLKNPISSIVFDNSDYTMDALSSYNSDYSINSLWSGNPYSYATTLSGSGSNLVNQTQVPSNSNNGKGSYQFTPEIAGNYTLVLSSTEESSNTNVSGSTTIYVAKINPTYTAPTVKTGLVYNGSNQELFVAGESNDGTFKYSIDNTNWSIVIPTKTDVGTYTIYWKFEGDANHTDISSTSTTVSITKKSVTITAASNTKTYDGTALTDNNSTQVGLVSRHTYTCTVTGTQTTLGSSSNIPSNAIIKNASGVVVTDNYNITYVNGTLTVGSLNITVTADSTSKTYDGTELTKTSGCTVTSGSLVTGHTITSTNSGSATNVGDAGVNTITTVIIKDASGNNVTTNYNITKKTGKLTINKREITVTGNSSTITYDAQTHTLNGVTVTKNTIVANQTITTTNSINGVNVADTAVFVPVPKITDANNNDVTYNYNITIINGKLTINKRNTTVTADSSEKTYDGTPLTKTTGCTATNVIQGHTVTSTNSGSVTNVNDNGVNTITDVVITDLNSNDVTANYNVITKTGTLTVTEKNVYVYSNNGTKDYDGTPLQVKTAYASGLVSGHKLHSYVIETSITNAGSTSNVVSDAIIYDASDNDVTSNYKIVYRYGKLTINKITPEITLTGVDVTFDGAPHYATCKVTVDGTIYWSTTTGVTTENGSAVSVSANIDTAITSIVNDNADKNPDFTVYLIFVPTDSVNYNEIEEKTVSLNISDAPVTLPTPNDNTLDYNDTKYNCTFTNGIGGSITNYRWSYDNSSWTTSKTNPSFKNMGIYYIQAYYTADGNHKGSNWTTSATLTITKKTVRFISNSATYTYDDETHELTGATVESGYTLVSGHTFEVLNSVSGKNVADTKTYSAEIKILSGTIDVTNNYNITEITDGKLTINPKEITVTADSSEKTYDGEILTVNVANVSNQLSGHHLHACTITGSILNVGTVNNVPTDAKIYSGIHEGDESDVTANYSITYVNGILKINQRDITFTANNAEKVYDGDELTVTTGNITAGTLASTDHIHSYTITASQTNAGTSNSVPSDLKIYNGTHSGVELDMTDNYNITYVNGTLTVTKANSTLNISGGGTSFVYNTTAQGTIYVTPSVDGKVYYTTNNDEPSTSSYNKAVLANTKTSITDRINAGTTTVKTYLVPSDTVNYNNSDIETTTITIAKADTTAQIISSTVTYDGNAKKLYAKASVPGTIYFTWNGVELNETNYNTLNQNSVLIGTVNTEIDSLTNVRDLTYLGYFVPTDNDNYNDCKASSGTWKINKANTSVSITGSTVKFHNTARLTVSGGEGGTIKYATSEDNNWSGWSETQPEREAVGTTYVKAYVAGDSNHNDSEVTSVVQLVVNKATDHSITVTLTDKEYSGNSLVVATAEALGCTYYLAFSINSTSTPTSDAWTQGSLSATNAGTYYVWKKGEPDSNHIGDIEPTYIGTVTISKVKAEIPTLTGASAIYHNTATASATGGLGGTIYYVTSDTEDGIYGNETTEAPTRTAVGTTYVKAYSKGDSNHLDSDLTTAKTITVAKATDTSVTVTYATDITYNGSAQELATVEAHGCESYYIGYNTENNINTVIWSPNKASIKLIEAGTYYIFKKGTKDENHSTDVDAVYDNTVTIAKAASTLPTTWAGETTSLHSDANISVNGYSGGTIYYATSEDNNIWSEWTTEVPVRKNEIGTTYVKCYIKGDSNHNNSNESSVIALTLTAATDAWVKVTLTDHNYTGSEQIIATAESHGCSYRLGIGDSETIEPTTWFNTSLKGLSAGTYYIWVKGIADAYHASTDSIKAKFNGTVTISKVKASKPTLEGQTVSYHGTAKASATGATPSEGTIYYVTCSNANGTYGNDTTTAPTRTAVGTTYVKAYIKGDSNHTDSDLTSYVEVKVNKATDASIDTNIVSSAITYNGSEQTIATITTNDGCETYTLGYNLIDSTENITWMSTTTSTTLNVINAGTYYIFKKGTPDGNHSNVIEPIRIGIKEVLKLKATAPTLTGSEVAYHNTASLSITNVDGGTVHYITSNTENGIYKNDTTTAPTRTAVGTTWVKAYIEADSNHITSNNSIAIALTVNQATDASVTVTINSTSLTYNGSGQTLATATSHGCSYTLGYSKTSSSDASTVTWMSSASIALTATDANTYYVWYKATPDGNHSNTINATYFGTKVINTLKATPPTLTGLTVAYHDTATASATGGSGGTIYYVTSSSENGTYGNETTTAPSRTAVGTTYVKAYIKADSNHTNSDYTTAKAITVAKATDASVTVTINSTSLTYSGSVQILATATSHGCSYTLGYSTSSSTDSSTVTWMSANTAVSRTAAGTYYIWYKASPDGNHSNTINATYFDTKVINRLKATAPTLTGATVTYNGTNAATASATGGSGGTIYYVTSSSENGTYGNETTTAPSRTAVGTTYVKAYIKADSNHTNSDYTTAKAITVNQATDASVTVTINSTSLTYSGSAQTLATATSHGCNSYTLGYSTSSSTDSSTVTWMSANTAVSRTAAGTYYIWYKAEIDGNHSNTINATYYNSKKIEKAASTLPTVWNGSSVSYHTTATLTATGFAGGDIYYSYSTDNKTTWSSWSTTKPTRSAVGSTFVKCYIKGDSNHNDSSASSIIELKVNTVNDARIGVSVPTNDLTYNGSAQTIATIIESETEGCTWYLGTGTTNNATTATITWKAANTALTVTNAGTYHIFKKGTPDSSHSNTINATYVGDKTVKQLLATTPTLTGQTVAYHNTATVSTTPGSNGTVHYVTSTSENGTYGNDTTTAPTRSAVGSTWVKAYMKAADSNHSDSNYSSAVELKVNQATDAYVTPAITSSTLTYNRGSQKITTTSSEGCTWYLGFGTTTNPATATITWNSTANTELYATNAGTYYIFKKATADGNHSNTINATYVGSKEIKQYDVANCTVTLSSTSYTYDGSNKTPTATVKHGTATLVKDTEYTVSYSNNKYAGTATVTITGNGNYKGTNSPTFTIEKATPTLTSEGGGTFTYNNTDQGTVYFTASVTGTVYYTTDGSTPTTSSTSKSVNANTKTSFVSRKNAGTTTVKAYLAPNDSDNYTVSETKTVTITVNKATLSLSITNKNASTVTNPTYGGYTTLAVNGNTGNGSVTWSSSNTSYITVTNASGNDVRANAILCGVAATITATVAETTNYNSGTATVNLTPQKANDVPTFSNQTFTKVWGKTNQTVTFTAATANTNVSYTLNSAKNSSNAAVSGFSISDTTITINFSNYSTDLVPGTYTLSITATSAGNTNYVSKSTTRTMTITISKATDTAAVTMEDWVYGHQEYEPTITTASEQYVVTYYNSAGTEISKPTKYSSAGTYKVKVTASGNAYYTGGAVAEYTFNINVPYLVLGVNKLNYSKLG